MSFIASPVSPNAWGFDTVYSLTHNAATAMSTPMQIPNYGAQVPEFVFRYVPLNYNDPLQIGVAERDAILATGKTLLLVQRVNYPGWVATAVNGTLHGNAAAKHAQDIAYPAGCHLMVDMEGIANSGGQVYEYLQAWCMAVAPTGPLPGMYNGYSIGMTPDLLAQHTEVKGFWSDFGQRTPPTGVGFMCKQHPQIMHCGMAVDPDQAFPDQLGRTLMGMKLST